MKCPRCGLEPILYAWTHMHKCRLIKYNALTTCSCCNEKLVLPITAEAYYAHFATHDWTKVIVREALEEM